MEKLAEQDVMVSASFVYSFEDISGRWGKYPDWVEHPTVGNYKGLKKIRFYYASNEALAFALDFFSGIRKGCEGTYISNGIGAFFVAMHP